MRSPNFDNRAEGSIIDILVLHYTGMTSGQEALNRLCDPQHHVSAHYLIDEDGTAHALVDETKRAWHAGLSHWRGIDGINHSSIGIEIVNPGHEHEYHAFSTSQMDTVITLSKQIIDRYNIPARNIIGHSDIAPLRKQDPGELFNWKLCAQEGIGLWPDIEKTAQAKTLYYPGANNIESLQQQLQSYGYQVEINGIYDANFHMIATAFKRHFYPESTAFYGWDTIAQAKLEWLLKTVG